MSLIYRIYNTETGLLEPLREFDSPFGLISAWQDGEIILYNAANERLENAQITQRSVTVIDDTDSPYTQLSTDQIIFCDTSAGDIDITLLAAADASSQVLDVKNIGSGVVTLTVAGGADVEQTPTHTVQPWNAISFYPANGQWWKTRTRETGTIKCHRTSIDSAIVDSAWTDCTSFTTVADETWGNVAELNADGKTIDILQDGFYKFGGCVHIQNNTAIPAADVTVLCRLVQNGAEMRCSQRGFVKTFGANGSEDVLSYNGTAYLYAGDAVNLQYWSDDTTLDFYSNANFDSQVAYTIWIIRDGD